MNSPRLRQRIRVRRERRAAARAARRATIEARVRARTETHVGIDADGTVALVEVDAERYEAALDRYRGGRAREPGDPEDSGDDGDVDVPLFDDRDCPVCRAIAASRIGDPIALGRGAC